MTSDFDRAFEKLIGHEGGYVNDPHDRGGETKYGISKRSYPRLNIKALTLSDAKTIYKRDYWDRAQGDKMEWPLNFNVFDGAVNSGVSASNKWLQQAVGLSGKAVDGKVGPITMGEVKKHNPVALTARYCGERLEGMADMKTWANHGKGWARRIAKNLKEI